MEGGGIDSDGPAATVYDTNVSNNTAIYTGRAASVADGGGIANDGTRVDDNTVTAKSGTARGGAIRNGPFGELTLKSSTVRNNTSRPSAAARPRAGASTTLRAAP
ncbi:hypothetical protein ABT124_43875 [Streptomyces sp. NPDC001982]|uniref:hypothetical protein n=1 Tax=unclassified Streptomyces TaxID=2593676 RepID=UPI00332E4AD4